MRASYQNKKKKKCALEGCDELTRGEFCGPLHRSRQLWIWVKMGFAMPVAELETLYCKRCDKPYAWAKRLTNRRVTCGSEKCTHVGSGRRSNGKGDSSGIYLSWPEACQKCSKRAGVCLDRAAAQDRVNPLCAQKYGPIESLWIDFEPELDSSACGNSNRLSPVNRAAVRCNIDARL